ncbi:MAG: porphobilinogen synthase [Xanthomonadales bacterium]|nr:porphobilinogen synthase [Xanthomonadales bacterium]
MAFPNQRLRRLRTTAQMRSLIRETSLSPNDFILPLFVSSETDSDRPIGALPGCNLLSGKPLTKFAKTIRDFGVPAVLLFAITTPEEKDQTASVASGAVGPIQKALAQLKDEVPDLVLIADLCLCEYKSDGHCGILNDDGVIDNDTTLERIGEIATAFAQSGADVIAPSGMMDGMVQSIRNSLDSSGFVNTATMPYSAKYSTVLYGPFKAGTDSSPEKGLHNTHQMDIANGREAMREIALDLEEGADMIIIKPAMPSLDIIHAARENFSVPIAAYQVSGEAAMIRAAGEQGYVDAEILMMESLMCIKRAGANMIITYSALDAIARL